MSTLLQQRTIDKLVENGGKSVSSAMVKAGYSPATAKNPEKLTKSKGWQQLMKKYLSDGKLAALHKKLLDKKEVIVVSDGSQSGSHIEWTGQPHTDSLKALDLAYKLKAKFPTEGGGGDKNLIVIIAGESANRYAVHSSQTSG